MSKTTLSFPLLLCIVWMIFHAACNNPKKPRGKDMARSPRQLERKATSLVISLLNYAKSNKGRVDDSITLKQVEPLHLLYKQNQYGMVWSREEEWEPSGDSLFHFIENAKLYGLFPEDYHYKQLSSIRTRFFDDSDAETDRKDAALWARADLMLSDAFVQLVKDIKLGRLPQDSISMRSDSILANDFYLQQFDSLKQSGSLVQVMGSMEPTVRGYQLLKEGIKEFLDSASDKDYTYVPSPSKDAAKFRKALQKRLFEGGLIETDSIPADSSHLADALKKFQESNRLTVDGKAGAETLRMMNTSDREKFIRIAITMDRYKMLPQKMPDRFVWVNLPAFYLQLWEGDSVKILSRIVCGKPATRSPVLTSAIAELITYPKWTIPTSIIEKEVLPGVKKNPKYFTKKGFTLFDRKGVEVNPDSVDWSKYNKTMPYHVVQGSGDANALGVLKFNFSNKYAVYLHDTNERYLFGHTDRAMSHGCIRVQEWQQLAYYVIRNDAVEGNAGLRIDSMQNWLKKKEKHSIGIRNKLPLFIRYFTCEGKNGGIVFYDDIYGDDKKLAQKYFAGK